MLIPTMNIIEYNFFKIFVQLSYSHKCFEIRLLAKKDIFFENYLHIVILPSPKLYYYALLLKVIVRYCFSKIITNTRFCK